MIEVSTPSLLVVEPYTPGLSREYVSSRYGIPLDDVAKLGSAENPFGPSPKAAAAVDEARSRLDTYPDWTAGPLRRAVGERFGFDPGNVVCGAGETEIIGLVIRAFSRPGGRILMTEPCFPIYHIFAENEGRVPVYAKLGPDFRVDASVFLPAIAEHDPSIIFLTNPNSPTGQLMTDADIEAVCKAAGPNRLVVLDEAYIHFTQTPGGIELARHHDNLILLRTFSKAYGLAGLRIGFGLSRNSALIAALMSLKPTWNMSNLQVAGGAAAMGDDEHVDKTVRLIVDMRDYITGRLAGLNRFQMIPNSRSNFFMIHIVDPALDSTIVFNKLLERGVIVKDCSVSFRGLGKRYLRVDVNFRKHMDRLALALREIDLNSSAALGHRHGDLTSGAPWI